MAPAVRASAVPARTAQRIDALSAWRETPFFTDRERAALEWTETVTRVGETHVPDDVFAQTRQHFEEAELVALPSAVVVINSWNRLAVPFRAPAGTYQLSAQAERVEASPAAVPA